MATIADVLAGEYSLRRAILGELDESQRGIEHEASEELRAAARDANISANGSGTFIPLEILGASRLDSTTSGAGVEGIFQRAILADALRPHSRITQLGALVLESPQPFTICAISQGGTVSWVGEDAGTDAPDADRELRSEALTAHTASAIFGHTNQLMRNLVSGGEQLVMRDVRAAVAQVIDSGAVAGTGASNQPTGVIHRGDVGVVSLGTDGAVPTYAAVVDLEAEVGAANGDSGATGFLTSARMRKQLRNTAVLADAAAGPVWRNGSMLGQPAFASNVVPDNLTKGTNSDCSAIVYGAWDNLVVGVYGIEIVADRFTLKKRGVTELAVFVYLGVGLRQPEGLAVIRDARVS